LMNLNTFGTELYVDSSLYELGELGCWCIVGNMLHC